MARHDGKTQLSVARARDSCHHEVKAHATGLDTKTYETKEKPQYEHERVKPRDYCVCYPMMHSFNAYRSQTFPEYALSHLAHRLHRKRRGGSTAPAIIAVTVSTGVDGDKQGPNLTLKVSGGDARQPLFDFVASRGW